MARGSLISMIMMSRKQGRATTYLSRGPMRTNLIVLKAKHFNNIQKQVLQV